MTEADWLTSADPAKMLDHVWQRYKTTDWTGTLPLATERQMRLFCQAVLMYCGKGPFEEDYCPHKTAYDWASHVVAIAEPGSLLSRHPGVNRCTILRDIIGNPFRPVAVNPSWLTWRDGTIPRLAEQAYQERVGRQCERCGGDGQVATYGPPRETHHCGVRMQRRYDSGNIMDGHYPVWCPRCWWLCLPEHMGYKQCSDCHGTGTIATGELDPARMAIIGDAMEEAGCCDEEILRHLRSAGPHLRGCWAADLLRGVKC